MPKSAPNVALHLLEAMTAAVVVADGANRITYVNTAAEHLLQLSRSRLLLSRLEDLHGGFGPLVRLAARVRGQQSMVTDREVHLPRPGGSLPMVDIEATVDGLPGEVVFCLHERAEQDLPSGATGRRAVRSALGLSAMLAHEIKNPLSGIRGAAQLLEGKVADADKDLARLIKDEVDRIKGLVDQLEMFTNPPPPNPEPLNIHAVLEHAISVVRASTLDGPAIKEAFDVSLPCVAGDRDQLVQIFINLLKNAMEHTKNNDLIRISTRYRHGLKRRVGSERQLTALPIEIGFEDSGGGIADEIIEEIFNPFVTTKEQGGGLGLAIVARYLDDMKGAITVRNGTRGAIFSVFLPAAPDLGAQT